MGKTSLISFNYTITGLEEGETYKIKVRARFDEGGSGPWSQPVHTLVASTPRPPAAPTGLAASLVFHDNVVLDWDDPDDDSITGYKILRRNTDEQDPGEFTTVEANTGSQSTRYTDSSVGPETNYAYHIRAINDDGESDPSSNLNVTTPEEPEVEVVDPDPPAAPTGLSASALQPTTVVLDWDDTDDENVDGYQILRRNRDGKEHGDGNGPTEFSLIVEDTESTDTSHRDSSATEETRYEYQVKARWGNLLSDASNTVQVETPPLRKGRSSHNTDPSLSSITVDSIAVPGFAHDRTSYEYGVASTVTQVTIAATTDADADWAVTSPTDADTADGHQVNLSAGQNAVTIQGTSEDGNNTQDYTLNVNQGVDTDYGWKAVDDLDTLLAAGNETPRSIWSDNTTMWVLDFFDDKIYAYTLASGTRDTTKEFDLDSDNGSPAGVWSDGTTIWVADFIDDKLYAYTLANGTQDSTKEFDLHASNDFPQAIWSDGTTIWVADSLSDKLHAYTLANGTQDSTKEFDLHTNNTHPSGVWSDGTTIWVADHVDQKLYAYTLATKARNSANDFNTLGAAGNGDPRGIWSDGNTMWVSDGDDDKVYSYNMQRVSTDATLSSITVSPRNILRFDPDRKTYNVGVASDVTEATITVETNHASAILVSNPADPDTSTPAIEVRNLSVGANTVTAEDAATKDVYTVSINRSTDATYGWNAVQDLDNIAPDVETSPPDGLVGMAGNFLVAFTDQTVLRAYRPDGTRDSALDFSLNTDNNTPRDAHNDGTHLWVSDNADDKIYIYDLDGNRQNAMEFDLDSDNTDQGGIWSDGKTMWVADSIDRKVYGYSLSGTRQAGQDFDVTATSIFITGIWSDGVTMWVADIAHDKTFAYRLDDHKRDTSKDFNTQSAAGNHSTSSLWSDGITMWAIDNDNQKAYAYIMPVSDNTQLRTITIDGEEIPNFDPATRTYTVEVERETTRVTFAAQVRQIKAELTGIRPADADPADGHQVDLTTKTTYVGIDVRAQDGSTDTYAVAIINPELSAPPIIEIIGQNNVVENTPPPAMQTDINSIIHLSTNDPDGNNSLMTFSLDGESQKFFTILSSNSNNGALIHHRVPLDHEAMPTHDVIFTATDEDDVSASITVTITVNNVNEPGTVQFVPPTPITGIPVIAFVNDPDGGVSGETWQWYQGDAQGGPWSIITGQTSNSYTPADADEGRFFRVTATYSDVLGSGRSAEGVTDGPTVSTVCIDQTNACSQDDPGSLAIGAPARARIDGIADTDWFRFTTQADKIYRIDMMGADTGHGNLPDPYLQGLLAVFDENDAYQADGLVDDPGDQLRYVWRDWFTGQQHLDNSQYNDDGGDGRNARLFIRTGAITGLIDTPGYPAGVYYVAAKPLAENANDIGNDATYRIVINEVDDQPASPVSINTFSGIATVSGYLDFPGDQDPFTIDLPAGKKLLVSTTGAAPIPSIEHSIPVTEPETSTPTSPSVVLSETSLTVAEGDATGRDYTVQLSHLPTQEVTVTVTGHADSGLTLTGLSTTDTLTFTTTTWDIPQTVTVKGRPR